MYRVCVVWSGVMLDGVRQWKRRRI